MSSPSSVRAPIVWVVNEGGHDGYEKAEKYGRLMPLTRGAVNPFAIDRLILNLSQRLSQAQEQDYLLISGISILNMITVLLWLSKYPKVNLLQWSVKKKSYVKIPLRKAHLAHHAQNPQQPAE